MCVESEPEETKIHIYEESKYFPETSEEGGAEPTSSENEKEEEEEEEEPEEIVSVSSYHRPLHRRTEKKFRMLGVKRDELALFQDIPKAYKVLGVFAENAKEVKLKREDVHMLRAQQVSFF